MFIDSRKLSARNITGIDVCIIGAGPACLTLAKELIGENLEICILESGGLEPNADMQSLNESMESVGDQIPPCSNFPGAETLRTRQFGGTANQWLNLRTGEKTIRYVPLEEVDFEKRDWLPYSGWPIARKDLDPYYQRAQEICGLGLYSYDPKDWESQNTRQIPFDQRFLINRIFQFSTGDVFTYDYQELVRQASNIKAYLYASVYELEVNETAQIINRVKFLNPQGQEFWVTAKQFILATGGIENARLLLLSNQVQKTGLGNQYDLVGRFLMDHPLVRVGAIRPSSRKVFSQLGLYGMQKSDNIEIMAKPVLSHEVIQREKLLGANFFLIPSHFMTGFNPLRFFFPKGRNYISQAVSSGIILSRKVRSLKFDADDIKHLFSVLSGIDDILYFQTRKSVVAGHILDAYWTQDPQQQKNLGMIQVYSCTEQAPCPDNRIILGSDKDRFGYPKVQLNWRWDQFSRDSFVRAETFLKDEVARVGLGKLRLELDKGNPQLVRPSIHHNMGTTRMHDDPQQGVVDANCKVHGVANLFITGSSTFPTGGYANPTLTIVALAIRLADHLKKVLK
ncbi:MAG: GMC oxidoreductase [Sphaerospermopsis kisseleviana]